MSKPRRVGRRMIRQRNGNMRKKYETECARAQGWADQIGQSVAVYRIPYEMYARYPQQGYRYFIADWSPFFPALYRAKTVYPQKRGDA